MLRLPLSDDQLKLLANLIEKREVDVTRQFKARTSRVEANLVRKGLDGLGVRSSAGDELAFDKALAGLHILRELRIYELVDCILKQAKQSWTPELASALVAEVECMANAAIRDFSSRFEAKFKRQGIPNVTATDELRAKAEQHKEQFLEEFRREVDIRLGFSSISSGASQHVAEQGQSGLEVFCSYCHKDRQALLKLKEHLSSLRDRIGVWYDREITAGKEIDAEVEKHLKSAHIILPLVSPSFIASGYCQGIELKRAMERHSEGTARIVPVIIRDCYWKNAPFAKLKMLPEDAKPVYSKFWHNADEAFARVVSELERVVDELMQPAATVVPGTSVGRRIEVHYSQTQDVGFPENKCWSEVIAYPTVMIDNVGTEPVTVRKVVLRYQLTGPDGIVRPVLLKFDSRHDGPILAKKPINLDEPSEWRRGYYFLQSDPLALKLSAQRIAEADVSMMSLEIWIEEDEENPVFLANGTQLQGLHFLIQELWGDLKPLNPIPRRPRLGRSRN